MHFKLPRNLESGHIFAWFHPISGHSLTSPAIALAPLDFHNTSLSWVAHPGGKVLWYTGEHFAPRGEGLIRLSLCTGRMLI